MRHVLLIILDGWGHSDFDDPPSEGNAVELADPTVFKRIYGERPRVRLACSGADVGLPEGQMGNSEVGHLNLGAGRVVYQDIARVDRAIEEGTFAERLQLERLTSELMDRGGALHVVGLVSDGGVHSHLRHFEGLFALLPEELRVRVHCVTDGRDTSPTGGVEYVAEVERLCARSDAWAIASVTGRYWAMDRDRRWERTKRAFDLIAEGRSEQWADGLELLEASYEAGVTDEFVEPTGIRGVGEEGVTEKDTVLVLNFRADRVRQITAALSVEDFDGFERSRPLPAEVVTMTEYEEGLPVTVAFPPDNVREGLSEWLAGGGLKQLKVAETEKYAHVTYFFNGGEETPFEGEDRELIPSPKVATYDLQPEMSARGVTDAVLSGIDSGYDFILVNYANPDMVGHTGSIPAAVAAVKAVDGCLGELLTAVEATTGWVALVTADHGNCEMMIDAEGNVHTAHTKTPVDLVLVDPLDPDATLVGDGRLADVAPTVLAYLGVEPPEAMTGRDLAVRAAAGVTPAEQEGV